VLANIYPTAILYYTHCPVWSRLRYKKITAINHIRSRYYDHKNLSYDVQQP